MPTRCNILIKAGKAGPVQMYQHCDGYPSGVGQELSDIFKSWFSEFNPEEYKNKDIASIFAKWLELKDCSYEYEGPNMRIHEDIEYLYTIDLDNETVRCSVPYEYKTEEGLFVKHNCDKEVYIQSMHDNWDDYIIHDGDEEEEEDLTIDEYADKYNDRIMGKAAHQPSQFLVNQHIKYESFTNIIMVVDDTTLTADKKLELQFKMQSILNEMEIKLVEPIKFI